jgi:serpin B
MFRTHPNPDCRTLAALLAVLLPLSAQAAETASPPSLVAGDTAFAFDLYSHLTSTRGNLFFSPFSISTCLAMTYAGAKGETAHEMAQVLHLQPDPVETAKSFAALQAQLNDAQKGNGIELTTANGLWAQQQHPFLPAFLATAHDQYQANLKEVDFSTAAGPVRQEINDWVSTKTRGKIADLLQPGALNSATRLVLVNAIYFKGRWAEPFKTNQTTIDSFNVTSAQKVQTPLMHLKARFRYAELDGFQLLELPYAPGEMSANGPAPAPGIAPQANPPPGVGRLSLVVLLPKDSEGLIPLENSLNEKALADWLALAAPREVEVFFPKFKMTVQFSLAQILAGMGMPAAFSPQADFSGMDGRRDLFISALVHKAFVEVNEGGTEAAAATGTVMALTAFMPKPAPVFRADHPFIFLIRDELSGSVLFLGRMVDPTK